MRKILIRLGVVLLSILSALGVLEIVVRIFWNKIQGPLIPMSLKIHRVSANKKLGYELIPNSSTFLDNSWYRINSEGMRDYDTYRRSKPAGAIRIAALGDSLTFGMSVPLADTWPKQLEEILRRQKPRAEVLNFGVMGYDTPQEAEQIRTKVMSFQPDIIVIGYSLSDIGILSRERRELKQYHGYHKFLSTGIGFLDRALAKSRLYMLLKNRLFLLRTKADTKPPPYSKDGYKVLEMGYNRFLLDGYYMKENRDRLMAAFVSIQEATQPRVPVVVAIFPELTNLEEYMYAPVHKIVEEMAKQNGFLVLDPLAEFQKYDSNALRISKANAHATRRGNGLFAQTIAVFLQESGLLR